MKTNQYHILNGDALYHRFPPKIKGEFIIMRECLIDFPFGEWDDEGFFEQRASYLSEQYEEISIHDYTEKSVPEFEKMANIPIGVPVNLWFEDDLFCQTNLWFIIYFLQKKAKGNPLFLIRPKNNLRYGFGDLNKAELSASYQQKTRITQPRLFADLWEYYASDEKENLQKTAQQLQTIFPFITATINARLDYPNKPISTLKKIMKTSSSNNFTTIFERFSEQEAIYGLGDLQVKKMITQILKSNMWENVAILFMVKIKQDG